ncbi:MAG: helix-turn-helix domain-containing protein [Paludibacteraceae bacterium]
MLQKIALMLEQGQQQNTETQNVWFDLQDLQDYLPEHPAAATIYGWVSQRTIPYNKNGKRLRFNKVEIDKWLNSGRQATRAELLANANKMLHKKF